MMEKHMGLDARGWRVTTNKRKTAFGVCSYTKREIQLSAYLIPECTEEGITDTILHEIAHALTPGHHHDNVWKRKCIELGGNGERVGSDLKYKKDSADVYEKLAKYTLTCPVCGEKIYMNRRPTRSSSCGKHGKGYNSMYKLTITQNY
jgi:predicted SprT family Zn-dependent metalloprotease